MKNIKRFELASEVYQAVYDGTEYFRGNLGRDLAYLLGAILKDTYIDASPKAALIRVLRKAFVDDALVWKYIVLE